MNTTPGPWYVRRFSPEEVREANYIDIVNIPDGKLSDYPDGWLIAEIDAEHPVDIANARLIAAAPSLLEALEAVEWVAISGYDNICPSCAHFWKATGHHDDCKLQAAIQLAKGEKP